MSNHNHKSAFAVRCHTFGKAEKRLYDFAKEYFGKENTFLVLNTEEALDIPSAFNKIIFNSKKILSDKELFWQPDTGWRCGDYSYYAMHHVLSEYKYFWLAEPDLRFCNATAADFFQELEEFDFDFLAPFLNVASEKLDFFHTAKVLEAQPMSCLFPLTRLSTSSIPKLFEIRKKISKNFFNGNIPASAYPNDEIFVSTVTRRLGMKCAAIDKISSSNFLLLRSDPENVLLEEQVENIKADMVMHPVLSEKRFVENRKNQFNRLLRRNRDFSSWLWFALNKTKNKEVQKKVERMFVEEFEKFLTQRKDG